MAIKMPFPKLKNEAKYKRVCLYFRSHLPGYKYNVAIYHLAMPYPSTGTLHVGSYVLVGMLVAADAKSCTSVCTAAPTLTATRALGCTPTSRHSPTSKWMPTTPCS